MRNANRTWGKYLPNLLSGLRIPLSLLLMLFPALSGEFLALYLVVCLTDVLDGFLARRLKAQSLLGARLDSAADFLLVIVLILKLWPVVAPGPGIVFWVAAITLVRLAAGAAARLRFGRFGFLHTWANKLTGAMLAFYPLTLLLTSSHWPLYVLLLAASASAIEELLLELSMERWDPDRRGLYHT